LINISKLTDEEVYAQNDNKIVDALNSLLYKTQNIGFAKPFDRTSVAENLHVGGELKVGEHFLNDYALKEWVDTLYALKADVELDNLIL
jgi:hypothetical protein